MLRILLRIPLRRGLVTDVSLSTVMRGKSLTIGQTMAYSVVSKNKVRGICPRPAISIGIRKAAAQGASLHLRGADGWTETAETISARSPDLILRVASAEKDDSVRT